MHKHRNVNSMGVVYITNLNKLSVIIVVIINSLFFVLRLRYHCLNHNDVCTIIPSGAVSTEDLCVFRNPVLLFYHRFYVVCISISCYFNFFISFVSVTVSVSVQKFLQPNLTQLRCWLSFWSVYKEKEMFCFINFCLQLHEQYQR